ncbi:MAG TPA: molybdopterin oxidoreductase family protein, partial [Opitutaceae bacterium]|nr:molybdopterin oxidoreductase family protein [Opitutaceae bacterium]
GSRLFANATSLLGGYNFADAAHRAHVARILNMDTNRIPAQKGLAYDQIVAGIESGEIKGLWVVATNPAHSWINQGRFAALRERLDFLVVQDMYATTETARCADLVLPAAGWGEKTGTLINSERRLGLVKKVARAPGQALGDFAIFKLIAQYWGCGDLFARWTSPEAVFQILKELSRGQPCDFTGIRDYAQIEACGGIQWPYAEAETAPPAPARRLFSDGKFFTADGRARFVFDQPRPLPEAPDADYPFLLLTGRGSSAQWHTGSRTDKSDVLKKLAPSAPYVEINPVDATRLKLRPGDNVRVRSRRGEALAAAVITPIIQAGQVFLPMHFATVNRLTLSAFDPQSRQPAYKACAVAVEKSPYSAT